MKAAVLHELGQSPRFEQFPEPTPETNEAIVQVRAAALKPVDKQMAGGSHYASPGEFPVVCGIDGVGHLSDGSRVFFAAPRKPHGAMAERTVVHRARCWAIPSGLDEVTAAALVNPGMSAWLSLTWRAMLATGESVLVLGATGTTGRLAIQVAKLLGAGRVIAAGRNEEALASLHKVGADSTIWIGPAFRDFTETIARELRGAGFQIILDYLWGAPTEALLAAMTSSDFAAAPSGRLRLVQVGESAGPTISLAAAVLRSSALEILGAGSGSAPPLDVIRESYDRLLTHAAAGELHVETETIPLAKVEEYWERKIPSGVRLVVVP